MATRAVEIQSGGNTNEPNLIKFRHPYTLWASFVIFMASMLVLLASIVFYLIEDSKNNGVLGDFSSPARVTSTRPGIDGPAVIVQGMLLIQSHRCILDKESIVVQLYISYRTINGESTFRAVQDPTNNGVEIPRPPGCYDQQMLLILPERVSPGNWIIEALERVPQTGEIKSWFSEPFLVIPRE